MEIQSVNFIKGVVGTDPILEDGRPRFSFVGRSNVGKSSVLNSLFGTKHLVKTSSKPGKTQQINVFLVNDGFYFDDLPGYGYAKISEKKREKIRKLILWYFARSGVRPQKVVLILDVRVGLTDLDRQMIDIVRELEFSAIILANKIDKVNQKELYKALKELESETNFSVVPYSARTEKNRAMAMEAIFS